MGHDLTLLPIDRLDLGRTEASCYEPMRFVRHYDVLGQIIDLTGRGENPPSIPSQPIPPTLWICVLGESGEVKFRDDPNGNELRYTWSKDLKKLGLPEDAAPKNRAILAYIRELPDDVPIVLLPSY